MNAVKDLNCPEELCKLDTTGMFEALMGLPAQCGQACWDLAGHVELPEIEAVSNIVVTGLGAGHRGPTRVYTAGRMAVPVIVNRDYVLPEFVGPDTLVFAVSYSGNTEETLSAYEEARLRGASVVAVTTGGRLGELAGRDGVPLIGVPGGISRAATGFCLSQPWVLQRLGLLPDNVDEISEMIDYIRILQGKLAPEAPRRKTRPSSWPKSFLTDPGNLGFQRHNRGCGPALEGPDQRKRQGPCLLERAAGIEP